MTDTHCHLFSKYYSNIDEVITNAMNQGVNKFIVNGYDMDSNKEVLELISKYDNVYGALGFHPDNSYNFGDEEISFLEDNLSNSKIVAVGEIGLDYHYDGYDKNKQIDVFKKQIDIAKKFNKPLIIHSRDSINDTYNIIKSVSLKKILHCYSGSLEMARLFIKCETFLGIGGIITFKNGKNLKEVVLNIGLEHLVLETDSPYLTPEPFRGRDNEPKYLSYILSEIARIKGVSVEEANNIIGSNVCNIFDI